MSTTIKPEVSIKNDYYVEKERYYELKHFCLQWPTWRRILHDYEIRYPQFNADGILRDNHQKAESNPTAEAVEKRDYADRCAKLVNKCAYLADGDIWYYILLGVTEGLSYEILQARHNIPCGREYYYNRYRKFFWLLDKARG